MADQQDVFQPRVIRWSERSAELAWNDDGSRPGVDDEPDHMISMYHDGDLTITTGGKVLSVEQLRTGWTVKCDGKELVQR